MTTLSCATCPTVLELAAWCRLACDVLDSAEVPYADEQRSLQRHLVRAHRRHYAEWRRWLGENGMSSELASHRIPAWNEVKAAARSRDPRVVQSAHALLRRAVMAAYDRAAMRVRSDAGLRARIQEQRQELAASYTALVHGQPFESVASCNSETAPVLQSFAS